MKQFNPNQAQLDLFLEAGKDAAERVALLNEKIARLEGSIVTLPAMNEAGDPILNGVNRTIQNIIDMYKDQIKDLMVLANNAKE